MSLATRCTACGTIFRVVQDQLRVSEGWVRCGRCAEVFDAREQLFDIDREAPPPWPTVVAEAGVGSGLAEPYPPEPPPLPPPQPSPVWTSSPTPVSPAVHPPPPAPASQSPAFAANEAAPQANESEAFFAEPQAAKEPAQHSRLEPQWVDEPPADENTAATSSKPAAVAKTPTFFESAGQDFGTDTVLAPSIASAAAEEIAESKQDKAEKKKKKSGKPQSASQAAKATQAEASGATAGEPMPEFMRRAQMNERWRRPRVRFALAAVAVLLGAVLAFQLALQFHNAIVAVYPQSRPAIQALCELSGCDLQPWRRIDVVGVEASALNQAGPNNQYQLTVNLRNKSGLEVATPWVELSLTDASGAVVSRRMLAPTDFKAGKASMPPGAEMPLQVLLSTGKQRVSGYTVEIFHP